MNILHSYQDSTIWLLPLIAFLLISVVFSIVSFVDSKEVPFKVTTILWIVTIGYFAVVYIFGSFTVSCFIVDVDATGFIDEPGYKIEKIEGRLAHFCGK